MIKRLRLSTMRPVALDDLAIGRIGMTACISVILFIDIRSLVLGQWDGTTAVAYVAVLAILTAAWAFFWLRLAAGPDGTPNAICLAFAAGSAVGLVFMNPTVGISPMYYAIVIAGAAFRWRIGIFLVFITLVVTVLMADSVTLGSWRQVLLIASLMGGGAVIVRRYVSAYIALQTARDTLRLLAGAEARADLARDLHDRVGQQLSAVILQGELLTMDLESSPDDDARSRAATVVKTARDALEAMREVVARERGPRLQTEMEVAKQLLEASGIKCSIEATSSDIPTPTDELLAWVVREGTSNILRHSGATACTLSIESIDGEATVKLVDDGRGPNGSSPGNGLRGLTERLATSGGKLTLARSDPRGAILRATVPVGKER